MKKTKRELRELKHCFPYSSSKGIKNEIAPLVLSLMTGYVTNGDYDSSLGLMRKYKITMELFKENIMDLSNEKIKTQFEHIGTTAKSALTREYNKNFKTSIVRKKGKKGEEDTEEGKKFDRDGNCIEAELNGTQIEEEDEESLNESIVVNGKEKKTKAKTKGKTKGKTKKKKE